MLKKLIIAALLLIIIGVGGSLIFYSSSNNSIEIKESQSIDYKNIDTIQINTVSTNIEVIASKEANEAIIELTGKTKEDNNPKLSVEVDGPELLIDIQEVTENKWFNVSPNFAPPTLTLKLYIPEKLVDKIIYNGIAANLFLDNVLANSLILSSTSGDIDGEKLQFKKANIKTVSGDIELEETTGELIINTESGDIYLTVSELIQPIHINSKSGDVDIVTSKEPKDINFKVHSVSGDISILDEYNKSTVIGKGLTLVEINTISSDIIIENY